MSEVLQALLTSPGAPHGVVRNARLATVIITLRHHAHRWREPVSTLKRRLGLTRRLPLLTRYLTEIAWPADVAAAIESLPPCLMQSDPLEPDAAHWLFNHILAIRPKAPVHMGSGMGTLIAALALHRLSDALGGPRLTVLEPDSRARDLTREALAHFGRADDVFFESPEHASPPNCHFPAGVDLVLLEQADLSEATLQSLSDEMTTGGAVLSLGAIDTRAVKRATLQVTGYVPKGRGITVMTKSPPAAP